MDYLAHALLAASPPEPRLGGLIGDFVKGPLTGAACARLPAEVLAGVALHRRIDSHADAHPAFMRSRARVGALRRRYAGVMVDMFHDHLLAVHWPRFRAQPLPEFAGDCYALLERHHHLLPERLRHIRVSMHEGDWLGSYRFLASLHRALDGMARHRIARANPLAGAAHELEAAHEEFEADFLELFPDALRFAGGFSLKVRPGGTAPPAPQGPAMPPPA